MSKSRQLSDAINSVDISESAPADAVTLDASGNMLVGKTSNTNNTAGVRLANNGSIATADQLPVLYLNRTTNDGTLLELRKDDTTVGSIGVVNTSEPYFADSSSTYDAGIRLKAHATFNMVAPCDNVGAFTDGALDFGYSGGRFRNLYLSGGVYLGGTGSANYLDDYEEGTFTVTLSPPSGTIGLTTNTLSYTKVGRFVNIQGVINCDATTSMSGTGNTTILGLPFTILNSDVAQGGTPLTGNVFGSGQAGNSAVTINFKNTATIGIYNGANNNIGSGTAIDFVNGSTLYINISFITA